MNPKRRTRQTAKHTPNTISLDECVKILARHGKQQSDGAELNYPTFQQYVLRTYGRYSSIRMRPVAWEVTVTNPDGQVIAHYDPTGSE